MVSNIILADRNRSDGAVLFGGNWFTNAPLSNLQNTDIEERTRSKGIITADTQFQVEFADPKPLKLFSLINHKMSQDATIRITASNLVDFSILEYDTGIFKVWPSIFNTLDVDEFLEENWLLGQLLEEDLDGYRINFTHLFTDAVQAKYWKCEIDDSSNVKINVTGSDISASSGDNSFNSASSAFGSFGVDQTIMVTGGVNAGTYTIASATTDKITVSSTLITETAGPEITIQTGYVEIGRLFMGPILQSRRNFNYSNSIGFQDSTGIQTAQSGKEFFNIKEKARILQFSIENIEKDEALARFFEMQRRVGISGQVFVIPDPDDKQHKHREAFLGRFERVSPISNPSFNLHSIQFAIKEII